MFSDPRPAEGVEPSESSTRQQQPAGRERIGVVLVVVVVVVVALVVALVVGLRYGVFDCFFDFF